MATRKDQIKPVLLELLEGSGENGIQYAQLLGKISEALPTVPVNTIHGTMWELLRHRPLPQIDQPAKGLYRLVKFRTSEPEPKKQLKLPAEAEFYDAFKFYLETGPENCTRAIVVGAAKFGNKWGTPDVIGRVSPDHGDIISFSHVIISAEIKLDTSELITAFGQACAYKLFSHKSYLVIPQDSKQEDISRLESLCLLIQIGLVLYNRQDVKKPDWELRVRPIAHQPDMASVNENLVKIKDELFPR